MLKHAHVGKIPVLLFLCSFLDLVGFENLVLAS